MALINKLTAIGDKIREKLGIVDLINLSDVPAKIEEVFSKGNEKEWSDFWNTAQSSGNRTDYNCAFSSRTFRRENFRPKYDIKVQSAERMFYQFNLPGPSFDLEEHLSSLPNAKKDSGYGIEMDFRGCNRFYYSFGSAKITRVGVIDMSKATASGTNYNMFSGSDIATVDKIISSEETDYQTAFNGASKLSSITFEGIIGKSISFSNSPLIKGSIISVITHMSDNSDSKTLTLKSSVVNAIDWTNTIIDGVTYNSFDEICDLKPNWTISLV